MGVMKFNFSRSQDFSPELVIEGFKEQIQVISSTKVLGIILTNDLKWAENTEYICKRAHKTTWKLRRLKVLDVDPTVILDVYMKQVRSVVELAVPAWNSGLTLAKVADFERVQKVPSFIILNGYNFFRNALKDLNLESLESRRKLLCVNFKA